MVGKIIKLSEAIRYSRSNIKKGKKVGLVFGGFDILHMGHINLFRFAKKHVDILIIGLSNDKTLKNTKGKTRPINSYKKRSEFLSEIGLVDKIFKIDTVFKYGDKKSFKVISYIYKHLLPTYIFSSIKCDKLWKDKRAMAKKFGIKFIAEKSKVTHSTHILKTIESEL